MYFARLPAHQNLLDLADNPISVKAITIWVPGRRADVRSGARKMEPVANHFAWVLCNPGLVIDLFEKRLATFTTLNIFMRRVASRQPAKSERGL